jgi:hypothetical protein
MIERAGYMAIELEYLATLLDEGTLRGQVLKTYQRLGEEIQALAALPVEAIHPVIDNNLGTVREMSDALAIGLEILLARRRMAYDDAREVAEGPGPRASPAS